MAPPRTPTLPIAIVEAPRPLAGPVAGLGLGIVASLLAVWLIWGSTYYVVGLALHYFPPLLLAGLRITMAGLGALGIARARGVPWPTRAEWKSSAVLGVLLLVVGHGAVVFAQQWLPSSLAALAGASVPLLAALWAWGFGTRPTRFEGLALAAGLGGVVVLGAGGIALVSLRGLIFLIVAKVCWSLGIVLRPRLPSPQGLMAPASQMIVAGPVLLVGAAVRGERLSGVPDAHGLAALLYLTVFGSLMAFAAFNYLLVRVRPTLASSNSWVNPVLAVFLGASLGGERIEPMVWVSGVLIVAAVALLVGPARAATRLKG